MEDYKNTKEGRAAAAKYRDILSLSRPEPSYRHPRMPVPDRAKIFSPFAALRGYDDEIALEQWKQERVPKKLLSEEEAQQLSLLLSRTEKGDFLTVRFFCEDTIHPVDPPLGIYRECSGTVTRLDPVFRNLTILDGDSEVCISFDDLEEIKLPK